MKQLNTIITPPATIGILGGGQLGQMLAMKAREIGYQVAILDPDKDAPAKSFATWHITTAFDDEAGLRELAARADVITTEFENVPEKSLRFLVQLKPVYPSAQAVAITQNRIKEKTFFNEIGVKTVDFYKISNTNDIEAVTDDIFPAILKTATLGYDGKGQIRVANKTELTNAFQQFNCECILEQMVLLQLEASVIVARNQSETAVYSVNENIHHNSILNITICPARIAPSLAKELQDYAVRIIDKLDYIGILVIEFFITKDNQILANEMAPRPHNSGHHTIESTVTSQFEQQLRAICNLKLGKTTLHTPSVMLNILGENYVNGNISQIETIVSKYDNLKLHLYGKTTPKIGRKMAHLTMVGDNIENLLKDIAEIKQLWHLSFPPC